MASMTLCLTCKLLTYFQDRPNAHLAHRRSFDTPAKDPDNIQSQTTIFFPQDKLLSTYIPLLTRSLHSDWK